MAMLSSAKRNMTFISNISTMASGTALGRLVTVLAAPLLARLFSPEDFGIAALVITLSVILNSFSSLSYEFAIVLPTDQEHASALSRLSLVILIVFCLLVAGLVWLILWLQWDMTWVNTLGNWAFLIPVTVLVLGIGNILRRWGVREKRFKAMSAGEVGNSIVTACSRIGLGATLGSSVGGLVTGYLAGVATELYLIVRSLGVRFGTIFKKSQTCSLHSVAHRYRDFAIYMSPSALLNALSEQLPIVLLGAFFSPAVVGFYALANRLVVMPIGIVGRSVRTVFLQRAVDLYNEGRRIGPGFSKITFGLAALGAPAFLGLFMYGEEAFSLLLSERWATAGRFVEVLTPLFYTMLVLAPMSAIFIVLERQRMLLVLQTIRTTALVGAFAWSAHQELAALDTLRLYSGLGAATNLLIAFVAFWLAYSKPLIKHGNHTDRDLAKPVNHGD